MKKILTVIGARPQFIKSAIFSREIKKSPNFTEIIVHTGQHYDANMSDQFVNALLPSPPKYILSSGGKEEIAMISYIMDALYTIFLTERPNCIVVFGDTSSTIASALVAKKLCIPLVHVEAGVRNYDTSMPEEVNRIVVDRLSDFNFCATENSYNNLMLEGFGSKYIDSKIFVVGDLMLDSFCFFKNQLPSHSSFFNDLEIKDKDYIFCTLHRQSNVDNPIVLERIVSALNRLHSSIPVIISLHPRTKKKLETFCLKLECIVLPPLSYIQSLSLLMKCKYVVSDSGGLIREAYFARKKSICVLEDSVWPEIVSVNACISCIPTSDNILNTIDKLEVSLSDFDVPIFGDGFSAKKILDLLNENIQEIDL